MATYADLNNTYKKIYNKDFPRTTLTRWINEKKINYTLNNNVYNYDLNSFIEKITSESYKKKLFAYKKKPQDYIGKTCGYLLITGIVPKEESQQPNYAGTMMYCKCLNCGNIIQERFSYLSGNSNYSRESCGCLRIIRHFMASATILDNNAPEDIEWLKQFQNDWDRFSFLNRSIIKTTGIKTSDWNNKEEYKSFYQHFWNDTQFNHLYDNWINKKNIEHSTFYDWWKPSIDHKTPKSRGGLNTLDNLQFLTYYENHSKLDMTWEEWQQFKLDTNTHSILFIEEIMKGGDANE